MGSSGSVLAVAAHQRARAVQDFESDRAAGVGTEVVIEDGAIGRIGRCRLVGRQRRIGVHVPAHADGGLRLEEEGVAGGDLLR